MATPINAALPTLSPDLTNDFLDGPAASPPPGVTSNLRDPDTLYTPQLVTLILAITFSTITISIRFYTKRYFIRALKWEDYTLLVAWMFHMVFIGWCFQGLPYVGEHMWDERTRDVFHLLWVANIVEILYHPPIVFVKISILLQYFRIFAANRRTNWLMFAGIHVVLWTMITFYVISMFFVIFSCSPRELIWNRLLQGTCYNVNLILLATAVLNLTSDIIILLLPQYSIWRLKINRRKKFGISALFSLGLLACLVTALRVQSTVRLVESQDFTFYIGPTAIWAVTEITLGIMCASLPVIPRFFKEIKGSIASRISSRRSQSNKTPGISVVTATSHTIEKAEPPMVHEEAPEEIPEEHYSYHCATGFQESDHSLDIERNPRFALPPLRLDPEPIVPPAAMLTAERETGPGARGVDEETGSLASPALSWSPTMPPTAVKWTSL